ncbi:MAG: Tetratricopeptide repeat protein [Flavipsychrobacter sp.]|jgi:tetratricopeptide (TPR) repeat protein|nr:Tetratricopeptide repeat protein [Flavipsychrobacter sp.]
MADWYRQTGWSIEIEEYFFRKLARARKESRAQYLKIQAVTLVGTRQPISLDAAEMLLQKLLNDYPDDRIERSQCLSSLGDIYTLKGNLPLALDYYKKAIDYEEIFPNVITPAYLSFAELVIKLKRQEFYSLAELTILNRQGSSSPFPIERYESYSFLSIFHFLKGNCSKAIEFATLAEQSASAPNSDLRYNKNLGIVSNREKWIDDLIAYHRNKAETDLNSI